VDIETIRHKALRNFVETGKAKGLMEIDRLRKMIAYLAAVEGVDELKVPPNYGAHQLTGDRAGTWSLTITRNWRMTSGVDREGRIIDLDLEDHH
jgi:toxin HigB-1